jgi:hypothetical protein
VQHLHIFTIKQTSLIPPKQHTTAKYHTKCTSTTKKTGNVANVTNTGMSNTTVTVHTLSKEIDSHTLEI